MPTKRVFTWNAGRCTTLPCRITADVGAWYSWNTATSTGAMTAVHRTGSTLGLTLRRLPTTTTTYYVRVDARYFYSPSVFVAVTVVPATLAPRSFAARGTAHLYTGNAAACTGGLVAPPAVGKWCPIALTPPAGGFNAGTVVSWNSVLAAPASNPSNAVGAGNGHVTANLISGTWRVFFWPSRNGTFTDTISYQLRSTGLGLTSALATVSLTVDAVAPPPPPTKVGTVNGCPTGAACGAVRIWSGVSRTTTNVGTAANGSQLTAHCWVDGQGTTSGNNAISSDDAATFNSRVWWQVDFNGGRYYIPDVWLFRAYGAPGNGEAYSPAPPIGQPINGLPMC
jgi:hypothetical protein